MNSLIRLLTILIIVESVLTSCQQHTYPPRAIESISTSIPTPISSLIESFIWQTDGLFAYRMLRPENWDSMNLVDYRGFATPQFQDHADRILLRAVNLQIYNQSSATSTGLRATLALFENTPSLQGWTEGIERNWKSNAIEYTLLRTLPQAKLYSVRSVGSSDEQIVAYSVDQKQPIAIDLTASGIYADIDYLQQEGILDDFIVMIESVQAIPQNSRNVDPPLE